MPRFQDLFVSHGTRICYGVFENRTDAIAAPVP